MQLSSMILSNGNVISDNVYAQNEQAASLVNDCSGDGESGQICVNNNPQTQGEDNVVNTPINSQINNPVQEAPKQVLQVREVAGERVIVLANSSADAFADCADGELATGGGVSYFPGSGFSNLRNPEVIDNGNPDIAPTGWGFTIFNPGPASVEIRTFVECAKLVDAP